MPDPIPEERREQFSPAEVSARLRRALAYRAGCNGVSLATYLRWAELQMPAEWMPPPTLG